MEQNLQIGGGASLRAPLEQLQEAKSTSLEGGGCEVLSPCRQFKKRDFVTREKDKFNSSHR